MKKNNKLKSGFIGKSIKQTSSNIYKAKKAKDTNLHIRYEIWGVIHPATINIIIRKYYE